jgi:hypothetical protein
MTVSPLPDAVIKRQDDRQKATTPVMEGQEPVTEACKGVTTPDYGFLMAHDEFTLVPRLPRAAGVSLLKHPLGA